MSASAETQECLVEMGIMCMNIVVFKATVSNNQQAPISLVSTLSSRDDPMTTLPGWQ